MRLTQQQLEAHLWGAANILRGKTAGQDYKNYILSLMFYKRLCDQWENEADEAIAEQERQQGRPFSEAQKAVFRSRGEHRFAIPDGSRWGDVLAASTNLGEILTSAMRAVSSANEELKGVFTVDWNQPAPDGSGKPLIPNEVVHALIQHFDAHDLSNASVPPDVLGRAYEYLIKQFADDAGAKAGEFFTPPRGRGYSRAYLEASELEALTSILGLLQKVEPGARERILHAVATFLRINLSSTPGRIPPPSNAVSKIQPTFSEDRTISPKQFMFEKQPRTDVEKVACLAYYLTHYRETPHFKTLDISKLNTEAAQTKFANPTVAVDNAGKTNYNLSHKYELSNESTLS